MPYAIVVYFAKNVHEVNLKVSSFVLDGVKLGQTDGSRSFTVQSILKRCSTLIIRDGSATSKITQL